MAWNDKDQSKLETTAYADGTRTCVICGKEWKVHQYNRKRQTCSPTCTTELRRKRALDYLKSIDK